MTSKDKQVEILDIHDIRIKNNRIFSKKTNHYLQNLLFYLRIVFRYNREGLDDLIDFYNYINDILSNQIDISMDELKILIYTTTDIIVNIDEYDIHGETIITEAIANLQQSLYTELEMFKLAEKSKNDDEEWESYLISSLKDTQPEFRVLTELLDKSDITEIKDDIINLLENNYPLEYATYNARKNYLEY